MKKGGDVEILHPVTSLETTLSSETFTTSSLL